MQLCEELTGEELNSTSWGSVMNQKSAVNIKWTTAKKNTSQDKTIKILLADTDANSQLLILSDHPQKKRQNRTSVP